MERRELAPIIKAQVERDRRELQELADEINPPDFDPVENADQVRQRGEFTRLCTSGERAIRLPKRGSRSGADTQVRRGR